ncbi:MAG: hypothetical protein KME20_19685 [Kaiparowitsia implicata GSE-PSE-MK54-09C]|nr:hypothetical protein [Kaiparowitsia implicata GSE-PSE-MK54-09C]
MVQVLEHTQHVLTLRYRSVFSWFLAAIVVPVLFALSILFAFALIAYASMTGFSTFPLMLSFLIIGGSISMVVNTWSLTPVLLCSFNKAAGVMTFTSHNLRSKTVEVPLDRILLVGADISEGRTRYGDLIQQHRPYIQAEGHKIFYLTADYISSSKSLELERLIYDFLGRSSTGIKPSLRL